MTSHMANPNISNDTFSIFAMKKNGELIEQATVKETKTIVKPYSTYEINLNPLPQYIQHMDEYLQELFHLMMIYETDYPYISKQIYQTKKYHFENNEFVRGIIFHRTLMRKGSYFYVVQQSDRGVRFLLYTMNRIHHISVAFGFSMILPKPAEELVAMQNELEKFTVKQITELEISGFIDLIKKSELFFL
jgi:hypothetical protein